jgi:hypothetical protein
MAIFWLSNGNLQEGTERTELCQPADPFGFLQKETKVTKIMSPQTLRPSFSWLSSVQKYEFGQRLMPEVSPLLPPLPPVKSDAG